MRSKITNYDDSVVITLNTNPNFAGFKQEYGFYPTATPLTFTEFVNTRKEPTLSTAFTNTMNAQPVAPDVTTSVAAGTKEDPILVTSPSEAFRYPPGTVIKVPDGRLFTVPEKEGD
jgi:hypothetical protein